MLAQTVKSVVKVLAGSMHPSQIILKCVSSEDKREYIFEVRDGEVSLTVASDKLAVTTIVPDVELIKLPPYLSITGWSELSYIKERDPSVTPRRIYEEQHTHVKYEAQMFLKLFRIMKERVFFQMRFKDEHVDCWFIDGKVFYVRETKTQYMLFGTNLHALAKEDKNYRIISVSRLPAYLDYGTFVDERRKLANTLDKEFIQVQPGKPVREGVC